mmetsp:Transcript_60584/g.69133  ORF Transcript_60584/g.69133 Transcript_60584/m.69133 type:complete len:296 (+) Transcript_60584:1486-2373(+)
MAQPGSNVGTKVELFMSCKNLINLDTMSKSDPLIQVLSATQKNGPWQEIGRTEQIKDNLNPVFATSLVIDYFFEVMTYLKFRVLDIDSKSGDLSGADQQGELETSIHEIAGARGQKLEKDLILNQGSKKAGQIIIRMEEITVGNDSCLIKMEGSQIPQVTCALCATQPMLEIYRLAEGDEPILIFRSNVSSGANPKWNEMSCTLQKLCNNDVYRPLVCKVLHHNSNGNNTLIGQAQCSPSNLFDGTVTELALTLEQNGEKKTTRQFNCYSSSESQELHIFGLHRWRVSNQSQYRG